MIIFKNAKIVLICFTTVIYCILFAIHSEDINIELLSNIVFDSISHNLIAQTHTFIFSIDSLIFYYS